MSKSDRPQVPLPGMEAAQSWREWTTEYVAARLERGSDAHAPTLADEVAAEIPAKHAPTMMRTAAYTHVGAMLRRLKDASTERGDGTRDYVNVEQLPLDGMIDWLASQFKLRRAIRIREVSVTEHWVTLHPEAAMSVTELLAAGETAAGVVE